MLACVCFSCSSYALILRLHTLESAMQGLVAECRDTCYEHPALHQQLRWMVHTLLL